MRAPAFIRRRTLFCLQSDVDYKAKTIVQWATDKKIEFDADTKIDSSRGMHYALDGTAQVHGVGSGVIEFKYAC